MGVVILVDDKEESSIYLTDLNLPKYIETSNRVKRYILINK